MRRRAAPAVLPGSSAQSARATNVIDQDTQAAASRNPLIANRPAENEPVRSVSHPMMLGPTNPPMVPIELMNASPPAAATPVRKRGGMLQNNPRAPLMPTSATAM